MLLLARGLGRLSTRGGRVRFLLFLGAWVDRLRVNRRRRGRGGLCPGVRLVLMMLKGSVRVGAGLQYHFVQCVCRLCE